MTNAPSRTAIPARPPGMAPVAALLLALLALVAAAPAPALAQGVASLVAAGGGDGDGAEGGTGGADGGLLAEARRIAAETGGTVVVVGPPAAPAAQAAAPVGPASLLAVASEVRARTAAILAGAPALPGKVWETLSHAGAGHGGAWIALALLLAAVAVGAGLYARSRLRQGARGWLPRFYDRPPRDRAEKVGALLVRVAVDWAAVGAFLLVGGVVVVTFSGDGTPVRHLPIVAVSVTALYLWALGLFSNLFAPDDPDHRILPFGSDHARRFLRQLMGALAITATVFGVCMLLDRLGSPPEVHAFFLMAGAVVTGVLLSAVALVHRRDVGAAIRGGGRPRVWRQFLGATWHLGVVVYLVVATLANIAAIALTGQQAGGTVLGPVYGLVAGFGLYGLLVIWIDRRFRARQRLKGAGEGQIEAAVAVSEAGGPRDVAVVGPGAEDVVRIAWAARWSALFQHLAAILAVAVGTLVLLFNWDLLDLSEGGLVARFSGMALVVLAAYVAYQAVKVWIDGKLEEEGPHEAEESEDGMGMGTSRLATLLPILRTTLLVTIVAVAGMVVLAGIGVNIAPLFAGAGVVGLAIGFGAQTLIRDVFSGAFFLIDDAFRRGEYIEIDKIRGSVEKINVRSLQLRHHNGPLHTIPFGEIRQLTNYSRDWVIMKLPLRVTYDTDVEKVRKLVKNLGIEMAGDPEIGPKFLQPPKSQGVVEMDDSAMIIRVKFMTKPGDQFILRRHVYQRIQKLFEENGIQFAHREVTVRIADDHPPEDAAERERRRQAAAGAVRPLLDPQAGDAPASAAGP